MPCFVGRENTETVYVESGKQTARLCAIFKVLQKNKLLTEILNQVDWKEAGVTKQSTLEWWARHQKEDLRRRQIEREEFLRKQRRNKILSKLTDEEKKELGL